MAKIFIILFRFVNTKIGHSLKSKTYDNIFEKVISKLPMFLKWEKTPFRVKVISDSRIIEQGVEAHFTIHENMKYKMLHET